MYVIIMITGAVEAVGGGEGGGEGGGGGDLHAVSGPCSCPRILACRQAEVSIRRLETGHWSVNIIHFGICFSRNELMKDGDAGPFVYHTL